MKINDMHQLAEYVGASKPTRTSIASRIYKDSETGVSFWADAEYDGEDEHRDSPEYITLSGYVEGTDAECPVYQLDFPFTDKQFDEALAQAEADANDLWDETHE